MSGQMRKKFTILVLVTAGIMFSSVAQAAGPILFVVPARKLAVRYAQDMAKLRSCFVVSYQQQASGLLLHVWDAQSRRWIQIDVGQYRAGALFATPPSMVVFMGTESEFPPVLRERRSWTAREVRLPTFDMAQNANACHQICQFTPKEWRWLAARYNLELEDRNAERRRYGRYGRPGDPVTRPMPAPVSDSSEAATTVVQPMALEGEPTVANEPVVMEVPRVAPRVVEEPVPVAPAVEKPGEPAIQELPLIPMTTPPATPRGETPSAVVEAPAWSETPRTAPAVPRAEIDPGSK